MKQRKFFALVFMLILLFAGFVSAGCGGGGTLYNLPDNPESPDVPVPDVPELPTSPDIPETPEKTDYYTITFDSDGGSKIEKQIVSQNEAVNEPEEPLKDGFTFLGWFNDEGRMFYFGESIDHDITLKAEWLKTVSSTPEELKILENSEYNSTMSLSLDNGGALIHVEVQCVTEGFAIIEASEVQNDPMKNAPG
ncbi:MAG: InlB B-repeat-containing protein [Synergistaceae bacterium]|nr:InlB B-repeat-containing protein [Synergistaceae bacterium]